jgi:hypothetical protein
MWQFVFKNQGILLPTGLLLVSRIRLPKVIIRMILSDKKYKLY